MATFSASAPPFRPLPAAPGSALRRVAWGLWPVLRPDRSERRRSRRSPPRRPPGSPTTPGPAGWRPGRWLRRYRRLAVALLLSIAAGLTVQQLTPAPADTVPALSAARDLPAGKALAPDDLAVLSVPRGLIPGGTVADIDSLRGQQLAVALRKGQLLSDSQLLGPGLLAGSSPGSAAVPLRMADPASIQLLSPGQLVNVVLTNGNTFDQPAASQVLAAAVPVLWTSGTGSGNSPWLETGDTEGLLVVAANAEQAARLAGASTQGKLFFVLVRAAGTR